MSQDHFDFLNFYEQISLNFLESLSVAVRINFFLIEKVGKFLINQRSSFYFTYYNNLNTFKSIGSLKKLS